MSEIQILIKKATKHFGTLKEVERRTGIHYQTLQKWKRGERTPSRLTIIGFTFCLIGLGMDL